MTVIGDGEVGAAGADLRGARVPSATPCPEEIRPRKLQSDDIRE